MAEQEDEVQSGNAPEALLVTGPGGEALPGPSPRDPRGKVVRALTLYFKGESEPWQVLDASRPFSVTIGRSPDADLTLPRTVSSELRRSVSRVHARLFLQGDQLLVEDLDSHNFTHLDHRVVFEPVPVTPPCTLQLGGVAFRLQFTEAPRKELRKLRDGSIAQAGAVADDLLSTATHHVQDLDKLRGQFRWLSTLMALQEGAARARREQELIELLERGLARFLRARDVQIDPETPWSALAEAIPDELLDPELLRAKGVWLEERRCDLPCTRLHTGEGRRAVWIIDSMPHSPETVCLVHARRSVLLAEGSGDEADAMLSLLMRVVQPILRTLREVESHRAATPEMLPHTPSPQVQDLCEEEQLWGISPAHLRALYYAELAAKRYFGAARAGNKLSVVFFLGDTGTGKSALARVIHRLSDRNAQPFYELNCAAIPVTLAESELFGYDKGAHDKAFAHKPGWFELASNGTLFLDEIGKTSVDFQSKLLKVLDTGEYSRLGASATRKTHCNIILATSEDPAKLCEAGLLLQEFWYRVGAFTITLAPLVQRQEDVSHLAARKLDQLNCLHPEETPKTLSKAVLGLFKAYPWPGNLREMMQYLEVAYALCPSDTEVIEVDHLPESFMRGLGLQPRPANVLDPAVLAGMSWDDHITTMERRYLVSMLVACEGNLSEVARRAAKPYQTVHNKMNRLREWSREELEPGAAAELDALRGLAGPYWKVIERD